MFFGHGVPSIPIYIFTTYDLPSPSALTSAWGAALVLLTLHPPSEHRGARSARPLPCKDVSMTVESTRARSRGTSWRSACGCTPTHGRSPRLLRQGAAPVAQPLRETVFDISNMSVFYGSNQALGWTSMKIYRNLVTAVIGPSGCGKSTFIRSLNRLNDAIRGFRLEGQVLYHGHDIYARSDKSRRGAPSHRDGLPEAQPVPEDDLRQHRMGPAQPGPEGQASTSGSNGPCVTLHSGMRSKTVYVTAR